MTSILFEYCEDITIIVSYSNVCSSVVNNADLVTDFSSSSPGDFSAETARLENGWDEETVTWKQLDSSWTSCGLYLRHNKMSHC